MVSQIITQTQAKDQGLSHYFTGKACKRGHTALRQVHGGNCIECEKIAETIRPNRKRKRTNPNAIADQLRIKYNLTLEQYDQMLKQQNYGCKICGESCPTGKRLAVDHCHITGIVRGLLCQHCNVGLGFFKDNPKLLLEAIRYLSKEPPESESGSIRGRVSER